MYVCMYVCMYVQYRSKNASKGHLEATSIIGHTLLMSLLSPISSRMGATSTVISGSSYFRILAGSQRNLHYGSTDVIGTCEVASKWPLLAFFLPVLYVCMYV